MKRSIFYIAMLLLISVIVNGQNQKNLMGEIHVTPPKFLGVENVLKVFSGEAEESIGEYCKKEFILSRDERDYKSEGTAVVRFVILPNGKLSDFNIINSVSNTIDTEIVRVLKTTEGMWKPGYNNGEPVSMEKEFAMAIKYNYSGYSSVKQDFKKTATNYYVKGNKQLLVKKKPQRAIRRFDNAVRYLPYDQSILLMRGLCNYELGNIEKARLDWERVGTLGGSDWQEHFFAEEIKSLKGYADLISELKTENN